MAVKEQNKNAISMNIPSEINKIKNYIFPCDAFKMVSNSNIFKRSDAEKSGYSEYDKYEWFRNALANNSECCCHTSD